jgi:hypothetical protein
MRCMACGAELILTNVIPEDTIAFRGLSLVTIASLGRPIASYDKPSAPKSDEPIFGN